VIEKQPPIESFIAQRRLDLIEPHSYETITHRCENSSATRPAEAPHIR